MLEKACRALSAAFDSVAHCLTLARAGFDAEQEQMKPLQLGTPYNRQFDDDYNVAERPGLLLQIEELIKGAQATDALLLPC